MRGRAFLSATFVPGSGHLVLGRTARGLLVAGTMTALTLSIPWTRIFGVAGLVLVWLGQLVDVLLVGERAERRPGVGAWLALVIVMGAVGGTSHAWYVEAFKIPAGSMLPTLEVGDHLIVYKLDQPARGDLIAFHYPRDPEKIFLKRVIGIGGDRLRMVAGALYVNDEPVAQESSRACTLTDFDEAYDRARQFAAICVDEQLGGHRYTVASDPNHGGVKRDFTAEVPAGQYYVLGDCRDRSHDSRYWGTVPAENVVGKAIFIWWSSSWDRLGKSLSD